MLSPVSITIELHVLCWTIASCMLAARPMFVESSSHIAHIVFSSSLEVVEGSKTSCCVVQGLTKAFKKKYVYFVLSATNRVHLKIRCRLSSYLQRYVHTD